MSNSEGSYALPVELIEMIVEHIYPKDIDITDDVYPEIKCSLLACTLISWSWHTVVRRYLFREVRWSFAQLDGPEGMALSNRHKRTFSMICKFLKDFSTIAQSIRKLHLRHHRYSGFLTPVPEYSDFVSLLNLIPHLQELNLVDVAICHQGGAVYPPIQRCSLANMNICYYANFNPSHLPETYATCVGLQVLIKCVGRIDKLKLEGLGRLAWSVEVNPPPSTQADSRLFEPTIITSVTLDSTIRHDEKALPLLFSSCIREDTLRSITLQDTDFRFYDALLRSVGPRLESLRLPSGTSRVSVHEDATKSHFPSADYDYGNDDYAVIHYCLNLRELILDVGLDEDNYIIEDELRALLNLLKGSQVVTSRYPNMARLTLCLDMGDFGGPKVFVPGEDNFNVELDAFLMSVVTNTSISEISVQWSKSSDSDSIAYFESYVKSMFPSLSNSNGLRFRGVEV